MKDKEMEFIKEWGSIKEASDALGIAQSNINACCNGRLQTSGGYIWNYKEAYSASFLVRKEVVV